MDRLHSTTRSTPRRKDQRYRIPGRGESALWSPISKPATCWPRSSSPSRQSRRGRYCSWCTRPYRSHITCGFRSQPDCFLCRCGSLCRRSPARRGSADGLTAPWIRSSSSTRALPALSSSSSASKEPERCKRMIKGQIDGIGTRPHLAAFASDKSPLIDQTYQADKVPDVPAAIAVVANWLRETPERQPCRGGSSGRPRWPRLQPPGCNRSNRAHEP